MYACSRRADFSPPAFRRADFEFNSAFVEVLPYQLRERNRGGLQARPTGVR